MIPRQLIPRDVRPPAETPAAPPRRLTTLLDNRELVPANWPHIPLDASTSIPEHMPLDVLATRVVVPRDVPHTALDPSSFRTDYEPLTELDHRVIVPGALPVVTLESKGLVSAYELPDVLDADVINSGEANLMVEAVEAPPRNWNWKGLMWAASVSVHLLFLLFLLLQPKLFPYRAPTQEQVDLARQQLNFIYMPPDVRGLPRTPAPAGPAVRVDPRVLRQIAPMQPAMPAPKAPPQQALRDTPPEAPPEIAVAPTPTPRNFLRPQEAQAQPTPAPQIQTPTQTPPPTNGLILPRMTSPGRAIADAADQALRGGGGTSAQFGGRLGGGGGIGGGSGGGGNGGGVGGGVEMLTPTEGVDFNSYLARVVASVKQNWYSIMPESVYLGDKGRVILQFRIMRNGGVPDQEPSLMSTSGKDPLDRAASSAIRASSPFEPLPPAFSGPFIELRFIFLYNEPLSQQ
jgi:outer membrane biosynthesis protein TonB